MILHGTHAHATAQPEVPIWERRLMRAPTAIRGNRRSTRGVVTVDGATSRTAICGRPLRSKAIALLSLMLLLGPALAPGAAPRTPRPTVIGVTVGKSTLSQVLAVLGPASAAYLGRQGDGLGAEPGDPVVLRFRRDFVLVHRYSAQVDVAIDPITQRTQSVTVDLTGDPGTPTPQVTLEEVAATFGASFRTVGLSFEAGEEEGRQRDCDDPGGEYMSLVYPDLGLEVGPMKRDQPNALRFTWSLHLWRAKSPYPPCVATSR
jgi:hypothetical protein